MSAVSMFLLVLVAVGCSSATQPDSLAQRSNSGFDNVPKGVMRVLPKDAIPALFEPKFLRADEARIGDDAYVIGVAINGEARAYSINLLDGHEIVNDTVGGQKIAATW